MIGGRSGYCSTIVSHNNKLYLGSMDAIENRYHILELDPYSEELRVVGTDYPSWENITLDSFGRLILNSLKTDGTYELKIINYNSGESTPYVEGIHLNRLGIAFDSDQNLYAKEGETEGIKKVHLEEHYDPPLDISNEPLFYDFSSMPGLVNRDFFDVNSQQEIFIPVRDTGEIVRGDMYGNLEVFATGFSRPVHAKFIEEHGALYITDWGNGIFKISAPDWLLPNIDFVIADVENCEIDQGIKNSLIIKLDKASNSIRDGKINAAIGQIQAFQHLVLAQIGHKIPIDLADSWIAKTNDILVVLSDY